MIVTDGRALDRAAEGERLRVINLSSRTRSRPPPLAPAWLVSPRGSAMRRVRHVGFRLALLVLPLAGCARLQAVGQVPHFSLARARQRGVRDECATHGGDPRADGHHVASSLWTSGRQSLLGDRRAGQRGDILTVVIEIDDSAEFSNSSQRGRSGSEQMGVTGLFGLPQRINENLPEGASMADAVNATGSSSSSGSGAVRRNEQLTLRVAATVTDLLDNGILRIEGSQEVRGELRDTGASGVGLCAARGYLAPERGHL
jgi:flagellar L-ring protein precursor FlgH